MSSRRQTEKTAEFAIDTSGFSAYLPETPCGESSIVLLLPEELRRELMEERRTRAFELQQQLRYNEERLRADGLAASNATRSQTASSSPRSAADERSFIKAFERGAARRNRARYHPVLTGQEILRVAARLATMREKDYAKRELDLVEKLKVRGALRMIVNPGFAHKRWVRSLGRLRAAHPHFCKVTDLVASCVARSTRSKGPLVIPPLHLWGPPGLGKTHYAGDLASALEAPFRRQSMENAQTTALLLGTERHWSSASHGVIFDQVVLGSCANPIILLDELDKACRGGQYDPLAPLHSLLEPATAAKVRDAALDIEFDASLVTYIATSNDPRKVPASLLSRFREFEILPPQGEAALQVAREIVATVVERQMIPGFAAPPASFAHNLAHLTAREIFQAVQDAVARAVERGRLHLELEDVPAEILGLENSRPLLH